MSEPTWRKPAGIALLLLAVALWAVMVVSLVERLGLPGWAQAMAYVIGGFAWLWLLPVKRLLFWMENGRWRR
jgi:hypothetical protein